MPHAERVKRISPPPPLPPNQSHPPPRRLGPLPPPPPGLQAIAKLAESDVQMIAMRCAGFDCVDLGACEARGIKVVRVPTYSPTSVAEHAVGLLFAVNR